MSKLTFSLLVLLTSVTGLNAHPLHVSVLNIEVSKGRLVMTMKTFVDDWEMAYFHYTGEHIDFKEKENNRGKWFLDYLASSVSISGSPEGEPLSIETDSIWFEDLSMTIIMHAQYEGELNSLYICNTLLTDIYPDQSNLTILSYGEKEKGIKFDYRKRDAHMKLK